MGRGRSESFVSDTHGRDIRSRAELALDADGRMLALRVESIANLGAYPGPRGPMIGVFAHPLVMTGQYDIGAASYRGKVVYTNTNSVSPYRGSGQPEAALLLERLVDKAARRLGLAPRELRRRNLVPASRFPYTTALGTTYDSGDYAAVLDKAVRLADLDGFEQRRREAESRGLLRGIGIAAFVEVSGGVPVEWGALRIGTDRRVEVTTGIQNIGTGHETTFPQIVAERLGVPVSCVTIRYGDTQFVKKGRGHPRIALDADGGNGAEPQHGCGESCAARESPRTRSAPAMRRRYVFSAAASSRSRTAGRSICSRWSNARSPARTCRTSCADRSSSRTTTCAISRSRRRRTAVRSAKSRSTPRPAG
jgi:carbon-monoxide dehydrogenase large subunit